jgi:SAM-dependent methyltransferase
MRAYPRRCRREGLSLVDDEVRFAADLYRGTAGYYDRYRLPYPEAMIGDLVRRAEVSERGLLLDLACGTGQLAFPLRRWFCEVWAVDSEPDMVELVRAKAAAAGAGDVRPVVSDAETLDAEPEHFEMVVIGNAFHRLDRDLVAGRILGWLKPGGVRGAVLVFRAMGGRARLAPGARSHPGQMAGGAWRRAQGSRGLGPGAAAPARSPGTVRRRIRCGRTS